METIEEIRTKMFTVTRPDGFQLHTALGVLKVAEACEAILEELRALRQLVQAAPKALTEKGAKPKASSRSAARK